MGRGRSAHRIVMLLKFTGIPAHIKGSGLSQTLRRNAIEIATHYE
jgi:hypothetical protein